MTQIINYPKVPKNRLVEVAELAEWVASENIAQDGSTDVESLLKKKGITISHADYDDAFCGVIECVNGRFHIYCNSKQAGKPGSGRARFTIAHELGHFFIDEHRESLIRGVPLHGSSIDYHPRNPVEQEANCFAAHLLLPQAAVRRFASRPSGLSTILALKTRFATSITGTAVRCCDLEIEPIAVVYWSAKGYGWKRLSKSFRAANCRKTIESVEHVDEGSATSQVLNGLEPGDLGYFETATSVSRWFPIIEAGSKSDTLLMEHAIQLGEHGYLTILSVQPGERLVGSIY